MDNRNHVPYQQIDSLWNSDQPCAIPGYVRIDNKNVFYEVCLPQYYEELAKNFSTSELNTGWKAHLSCAQKDLPKLWDIVTPILQQNNCAAFKCMRLSALSESEKFSLFGHRSVDAMQFTIYIAQGEEEKYISVLAAIEWGLLANQITPYKANSFTNFLESDKKIGVYTSVRYCGYDQPQRYLSANEAIQISRESEGLIPAYNCAGVKDIFEPLTTLKEKLDAEASQAKITIAPVKKGMWALAIKILATNEPKKDLATLSIHK